MAVIPTDSLQLAIIEETTPGQTPATPAFQLIRTTGETLTFAPETAEDQELAGGQSRTVRPSTVTGQTVSGDVNFDLHKAAWLDLCIAGVLANNWGECPSSGALGGAIVDIDDNTVGNTLKTFTIEKRFPDPATPGQYLYQRYTGCTISAMTLNITPNQVITGTFSIVGGVPALAAAEIAGATYVSAGSGAKFTAPEVSLLDVGSELAVGTNCWTNATLTLDSNNRGIPCIGSTGDRETVLGNLQASLAGEVYFVDQDILQAVLDNASVGDSKIQLENVDGDVYRFDLFDCKPTAAQLTAEATNGDLTIPLTLEPADKKICGDGGVTTEDWFSSVFVCRAADAGDPALP